MMASLRGILAGLVLASTGFGLSNGHRRRFAGDGSRGAACRPTSSTWFFTPLVTKVIARAALVVTLLPLFAALVWTLTTNVRGFGPLSRQPLGVQALEGVIIGDLIGYWDSPTAPHHSPMARNVPELDGAITRPVRSN